MRTSMDSTTYVHFDFRTFRISFFVEAEINTKMSCVHFSFCRKFRVRCFDLVVNTTQRDVQPFFYHQVNAHEINFTFMLFDYS